MYLVVEQVGRGRLSIGRAPVSRAAGLGVPTAASVPRAVMAPNWHQLCLVQRNSTVVQQRPVLYYNNSATTLVPQTTPGPVIRGPRITPSLLPQALHRMVVVST